MTTFTEKKPIYEYEFYYSGEKMIADRCSERKRYGNTFCVKDGQTYENVQWTSKIVGYKDINYTLVDYALGIIIPCVFVLLIMLILVPLVNRR
jgi:hypothetical protein